MGRHSIRTRILAAFFGALIALTTTLVVGIRQMAELGAEIEAVNTGFLPISKVGVELGALVQQLDRDHDRFARPMAGTNAGRKANASLYRAAIHEAIAAGRNAAAAATERVSNPSDQEVIARILSVLTELEEQSTGYETAVNTWILAQASGDVDQSSRLLADLDRRRQALAAGAALTQALVEGQIERISHRTATAQRGAMLVSISLGILSLVLSAALAWVALRALRPIGTLIAQVQRVAAGDLTGAIKLESSDEMGLLAREFNTMSTAVSERDQALVDRARTLEELQSRLRQVIDTITAGLVVLDGGTIQMLNPAAAALWDLSPTTPSPAWMSSLAHGHHERIRVADRLFTLTVVPFSTAGTLIVGLDVTEAEMVRERLQRSERLALVGQMLAQITHEVRNPLNAMSLNAELLMDEVEGPEAGAMLRTITEEVRRLEQLTERYLHLSRKRVPECQQRAPKALIEEVVGIEAAALEAAGLMVEVFGPATTEMATFDADAVSRALRNLIRNAAEAGAQALSIQVQTSTNHLRITLSDDGPGLSGEARAQAFDPFFTTKARGTGLGLAISRQELEEIGGGLEHDASHQGGSKFIIWLPVSA
jgi:nitrogen fixation/metabolism regulation signal transduction histidine kinase